MKIRDLYCRLLINGQTVFITKEYAEKYSIYLNRYKELWLESIDLYAKAKSIISTFSDEAFDEVKYSKPCNPFNEDAFSESLEHLVVRNIRNAKLCKKIPKSGKNYSTHYFRSSELILSKKIYENYGYGYEVHLKDNNSTTIVNIDTGLSDKENAVVFTDFFKVTKDENGNIITMENYDSMFPYSLILNNNMCEEKEKVFEEYSKTFKYMVEQHNYLDGKLNTFSLNEINSMFESKKGKNRMWYTIVERNYLFVNDENDNTLGYKMKYGYQSEWDEHIYDLTNNKLVDDTIVSNKQSKKALQYLKKKVKKPKSLDEIIEVFEEMCNMPIKGETEKEILYETGTYSSRGKPLFYFSLVRQLPNSEGEYFQIHLDVLYEPMEEIKGYQQFIWNFDLEESIFDYIKNSLVYTTVKDIPIYGIDVFMDET